MTEIEIDTDENGLAKCQCGANNLRWSGPADHNQREADLFCLVERMIGFPPVVIRWPAPSKVVRSALALR